VKNHRLKGDCTKGDVAGLFVWLALVFAACLAVWIRQS
jgi:hypothetical protein